MSFDYVVARLRCSSCGAVSAADTSTDLQTHLRASPEGEYLKIGDKIELREDGPEGAGYLPIRDRSPDEPLRVIESWGCPVCDGPFNWAEIIIDNGVIQEVRAVELSGETLDRVHYVTWDVDDYYRSITGDSLYEDGTLRADFRERLRAAVTDT